MKKNIAITFFALVAFMNFASGFEVPTDTGNDIVCDFRSDVSDKTGEDITREDVGALIKSAGI